MPLITNLSGVAGAPYRPLQPAPTTPSRFTVGPYGAQLRPSLAASLRGRYGDSLFLGLLSGRPDLDGNGGCELQHPGYARQPVDLAPHSATQWAIIRPVLFVLEGCPPIGYLGLFNAAEELEAFGALRGYCSSPAPSSRFEFAACQILVKRISGS